MLFFVTVTVLLATVNAHFYTDCGSKQAVIENVTVTGCSADSNECVLKRNTNVTFIMDFRPSRMVPAVIVMVHGVRLNLPVPYPLPQPDACKSSSLPCPLQPQQLYSYAILIPVLKSYPSVKVDVKWELRDDMDEDLVCIIISARIA